MLRLFLT